MKTKIKRLWKWLRKTVLNKEMLIFFLIAELIFWSPCIVSALLALIINPWWWSIFGAVCVFWAGPFTPAVPLQIGLALLLKKIFKKKKSVKKVSNWITVFCHPFFIFCIIVKFNRFSTLFLFLQQKNAMFLTLEKCLNIANIWRKGWDSNPCAGNPTTAFRVRLVMTTSIPFQTILN